MSDKSLSSSKVKETLQQNVAIESDKLPLNERREFLKKGALFASGAAATTLAFSANASSTQFPPNIPDSNKYLGFPVREYPYGVPSEHEANVKRRKVSWLTADDIASVSFSPLADLKGIITPNGLVFERCHGGNADINPDNHRLMIHGLVDRPLILTMDELMRFPSKTVIRFIECPANGATQWGGSQMNKVQFTHGLLSCCEWTGVPLKVLLEEVGIKPEGKWILAEGGDASAMTRSIPLEKVLDDTLVVYAQNGERLRRENGYPIRLFNPGWEANTNVKWLRRIKIGDKPWMHHEETAKYSDVTPENVRRFTWVQESNSVILSPCPEKPWKTGKGWYEIEGIAWSGKGVIKYVDISFDGGDNWVRANLKGLVLPKALTRFSLMYKWDGRPLLLQSRSVDETGYVQPTITQLVKSRGTSSVYHNNQIQTWKISSNGVADNVQVK